MSFYQKLLSTVPRADGRGMVRGEIPRRVAELGETPDRPLVESGATSGRPRHGAQRDAATGLVSGPHATPDRPLVESDAEETAEEFQGEPLDDSVSEFD
jgi:hypothetical protein